MPLTQQDINEVNNKCTKIWHTILNYGYGNIVYVPDGTIYADMTNGDGTFTNYEITQTCCSILRDYLITNQNAPINVNPQNIYFDLDAQKCRWSNQTNGGDTNSCSIENTPIKVVLNPVGNDGAFFTLTENDTCSLKVKFNYLFKLNCETLKNIISGPSVNPSYDPKLNQELLILRQLKFELESNYFDINNELDNLVQQNANLNYSITCNEFPTNKEVLQSTPETKITASQTLPFVNTGFGSLTNTTELSVNNTKIKPVYNTKSVNFCLTEIGLDSWRQVIGEDNYSSFINGVADSYTCLDVVSIYELNKTALLNNQPELLFECNTPFGEKTRTLNRIEELSKLKIENKTKQDNIDVKIKNITDIKDTKVCSTLLGQFENLSATVTLDLVNDNGTTTQFYSQTLFNQIDNLYNYLSENTDNSGFLVCGEASETETWASGCTGLIYPEFTNGVLTVDPESDNINVSICQIVKETLYTELYNNSGLVSTSDFNQSLSPNAFNSNWLTYETTIDDQAIITGITNNQIKLNVIINSSCGNLCLLVDQINMTKVCEDANRTNIFISQSPGFNLTRVIDNKKSWLQADSYTERDFHIGNYNDANQIRQTEYTVDEERLILNTKEIDLTMNMASAIENDVWCYLVDNTALLTGATLCDPCYEVNAKNFQDDECFDFQDGFSYDYMDTFDGYNNAHSLCCGDNKISFDKLITIDLSNTNTTEKFKNVLISELIDVKNRQTISSYPTLKALYNRYLDSINWSGNKSSAFTYYNMDQFTKLIGDYWVDLIEQLIPATTIWGNVKVYTNTVFDQQKFKYKKYTSLLCNNDFKNANVPSPVSTCGCEEVEVITTLVTDNSYKSKINKCDNICIVQMNSGSEFIGKVTTSSIYE